MVSVVLGGEKTKFVRNRNYKRAACFSNPGDFRGDLLAIVLIVVLQHITARHTVETAILKRELHGIAVDSPLALENR